MPLNDPETTFQLSDKLTSEQWAGIPEISREILDEQYRDIPIEGIYHSLVHTYEVVRAGMFAVSDPRLYELFGFQDSIVAYNRMYTTTGVGNKLGNIAPVTSKALSRAIQSITAPYLLSEQNLEDLYYCLGYALSMHDSVLWEVVLQPNGEKVLQLVEDGSEDSSAELARINLLNIYFEEDNPYHTDITQEVCDKLVAFAEHVIPLTNSRGETLQKEHLSRLEIYPFAREIKSIDLLGSYLGKSVENVYDLLLSLANEKLTRPSDDLEADPTTLNLEILFNYPRNYICSDLVYGSEIGGEILARFAELGFPLAGPIIIPTEVNAIVIGIVEENDPYHYTIPTDQKKHLTWKEIQIALKDPEVRRLILEANSPVNSRVQTINPS